MLHTTTLQALSLVAADGRPSRAISIDLSTTGAKVRTALKLHLGEHCLLVGKFDDEAIVLPSTVVGKTGGVLMLKFDDQTVFTRALLARFILARIREAQLLDIWPSSAEDRQLLGQLSKRHALGQTLAKSANLPPRAPCADGETRCAEIRRPGDKLAAHAFGADGPSGHHCLPFFGA